MPKENNATLPPSDSFPQKSPKTVSKKLLVFLIIGFLVIFSLILILYFLLPQNRKTTDNPEENKETTETASPVSIPEKVLENQFGFLSGGEAENPFVGDSGAAWIRPHPGPFLWDDMQTEKTSAISFTKTDALIKTQQKQNYGTLATLWPFAEWDQANHLNADTCEVSLDDEFLKQNDKKGRGDYLPLHRCNPTDWNAYESWITAIVERYDGDGQNDMTGLEIPVKYWEVMNEPDLSYNQENYGLSFYAEDPDAYRELLIETAEAIKKADPTAQILIAGAAGADEHFLNFYRQVLSDPEVINAFDIGNIHCISNDRETADFNVKAYQEMLAEFNIDKPIWVTEAEAFYGKTATENFELTKTSTHNALLAGAEKIFYTRYNFDDFRTDMSVKNETSEDSMTDSLNKYRLIFEEF